MVYKWDITVPVIAGSPKRKAYIYLPEDYEDEPERRYPVIYMFDGHNVFFDYDAAFGKSWGMCSYLSKHRTPVIIAAVECNVIGNGRMREYSPFDHSSKSLGKTKALGKEYMDWLTGTFKPFIDDLARTMPDREHTFIAGSSMGGLMALYGISAYSDIFSAAIALSPSLWVSPEASEKMLRQGNIKSDSRIYIDYGSCELFNHAGNGRALDLACRAIHASGAGLSFSITEGGYHCEAAWEKQVPSFMKYLGLTTD